MKPLPLLFLSGLFLSSGQEIRYSPAEGLKVHRRFEETSDFSLDEVGFTVDGETPPDLPDPDLDVHAEDVLAVTDVLGKPGEEGPLEVRRTYDEISSKATYSSSQQDEDEEQKQVSDLEGATVLFTWNEDDGEYRVSQPDDEDGVDADLLKGLVEDMDFRAVLPEGEVDEGDTWDVSPKLFLTLSWPGGPTHEHDEDGEIDPADEERRAGLADSLDGDAEATYVGTRDEDGVKVAVLKVTFHVTAESTVEVPGDEGPDEERSYSTQEDVEGEILWDLEHGIVHSVALDSDASATLSSTATVDGPQGQVELASKQVFRGKTTYRVTFTIEE